MEETTDPLVVVFAKSSGHGKTDLARLLGHLLSLEFEVVDCSSMTLPYELRGCVWPLEGDDRGSPLNNFLARKSGKRSIVFLDEFKKASKAIHRTLVVPFDEGKLLGTELPLFSFWSLFIRYCRRILLTDQHRQMSRQTLSNSGRQSRNSVKRIPMS